MIRTIIAVLLLIWSQILIIGGILAHSDGLQIFGFVLLVPALTLGTILIIRWTDAQRSRGTIRIIKRANFAG